MLTIKDLPQAQALDSRAMSAVSGGCHKGRMHIMPYPPQYPSRGNSGVVVGGDVSGVVQNGGSNNVGIGGSFNGAFDSNSGSVSINF